MSKLRHLFAATAAIVSAMFLWMSAALASQPTPWQIGFQDAATPFMRRVDSFNNLTLWIITPVVIFVLGLLLYCAVRFNAKANPVPSKVTHNSLIEVIWTVVPVLILVGLAVPSFRLLYFEAEMPKIDMTIKATGYQWYWGFEYPDQSIEEFDSYMLQDDERGPNDPRLLAVDNEIVVPVNANVRLQVTAADVIHAFAMPAFGLKLDAIPGRLNETWFRAEREGVFYGQCSELCGINHAFMPLAIRVVSQSQFDSWSSMASEDLSSANEALEAALASNTQTFAQITNE